MSRRRGTSESDLSFIGFGPYEDTLSRLDGGKDHKQIDQNITRKKVTNTFIQLKWHIKIMTCPPT